MSPTEKRTTHFGYQEVPVDEKASRVADVFHSVAARYDVMNDLMSMGIHRIWKRLTIERAGVRPGHHVLDIAGGTGDLTLKFSRLVGPRGKVVLADINASMLRVGRDKLMDNGVGGNVEYVQANAECLPFPDNSFDCITIAFGLRNVTDKDAALRSMARVLKPGGRLAVITFHSGEDRLVKHFSRCLARPYTVCGGVDVPELREPREPLARELSRKAIRPGAAELERNPRSRSAQLRVGEKL